MNEATEEDWHTEYLAPILSVQSGKRDWIEPMSTLPFMARSGHLIQSLPRIIAAPTIFPA